MVKIKINLRCPDNRLKFIWIIDTGGVLPILQLKQMKKECMRLWAPLKVSRPQELHQCSI